MSGLNERVKRQIALLAGDDLEGEQAAETRASIESCPYCRQHWVRLRGCLDMLDRAGRASEPEAGPSLWPAIESRVRPANTIRRPEEFNGWVPALSMAAACIALLIAGQMDGVSSQDMTAPDQALILPSGRHVQRVPVLWRQRPGRFTGAAEAFAPLTPESGLWTFEGGRLPFAPLVTRPDLGE